MSSLQRAWVCGLGASGLAAAKLLRAEGFSVLALDERDTPECRKNVAALVELGCEVSLGVREPPSGDADWAVVSPGLPADGAFLSAIRRRGIPIVSEMELGWSRFQGRTIAVTGSNGKSCVVKAIVECIAETGQRAIACGNYGLPVCRAVLEEPGAKWLVIEASSFQLETTVDFRPNIAILLNILPNHLDRHGSMDAYARIKARIFAKQEAGDVALVPAAWRERCQEWSGGRARWLAFDADESSVDLTGTYFDNSILKNNAKAVADAALTAGVPSANIQHSLKLFCPLPHRTERVGEFDGVLYINDSKATNLASMIAAIQMQTRPVYLIAGGRPKESDFSPAIPVLQSHVKGVLLIGEAADAMFGAWTASVKCEMCGTLSTAVTLARRMASPGDVVLLAPACTSYDQFSSYGERGEAFRKFVLKKD